MHDGVTHAMITCCCHALLFAVPLHGAGFWCAAGAAVATPCGLGMYNSLGGQYASTACVPCSAGTFGDSTGATSADRSGSSCRGLRERRPVARERA